MHRQGSRGIISAPPDSTDAEDIEDLSAGDGVEVRQLTLQHAQAGLRLDLALVAVASEFSRSYWQQRIAAGDVMVNGVAARRAAQRCRGFEELSLRLCPSAQTQAFVPQPMSLDIRYHDAHVLVLNKPAGLVVHPAPGNWSGTLLNGLLALDEVAGTLPRAGIVHRLDKDTSGLMVVARSAVAREALVRAIAAREVSRQYVALVHGEWPLAGSLNVNLAVGRDPGNRLRMATRDVPSAGFKSASSVFTVLQNAEHGALVHCALGTGRTHQIRVHAAAMGHALVGDVVYGGRAAAGMQRQALHAWRLAFAHPVTGTGLRFEVDPPADFLAACDHWGLGYNAAIASRAE